MESFENLSNLELEQTLKTNLKTGLTQATAEKRLTANGKNELPKPKVQPWYFIFLFSLIEPLQIILLVAAVISVIAPKVGHWNEPAKVEDFIDFMVIIFIVFLDAILQTVQTVKARKSVDALKSLSKPMAVVYRNGTQKEIPANELVIGDVVILEAGKYVPAELRIISSSDFMIDESILTGESVPVKKQHQKQSKTKILADMKNIAFMSTFTTAGRGVGVVIKTGINTEVGKISSSINESLDQSTPLEKKLTKFSYWISVIAVLVGILIFVSLIISGDRDYWATYLLVAITLAIGVIPESMAAVVSITLSFSTKRMAAENVIVKKLASVETLGSVNVICTDKTGTLTQNKMSVRKVLLNNKVLNQTDFIDAPKSEHKELFLKSLVLPNDSVTEGTERIGDPTELALVDFAELLGVNEGKAREKWPRITEIPFDSERKLMSTVNNIEGKMHVFTKGAVDQLLNCCNQIMIDNQIVNLTVAMKKEILAQTRKLSDDALRVLGLAFNKNYKSDDDLDDLETELIFLGAVGMTDPVRNEAVHAIAEAHAAGIRVVMITGDHAITALAIARDLDLAYTNYEVMSSEILEKLNDQELLRIIDTIKVFARVNPEHKVRIVKLLQEKGNIVSMTGDGVNDAPSLSKADIGVAMGITGTDVAKQAADVILTDDNFATIMKGVDEGRNVYQKIRRTVVLLMGYNLANVLSIFVLSLINHIPPLDAVDILYVNLVVESCLAIAMGMGPNDQTLMMTPPRTGKNNLLKGLFGPIFKIGIVMAIVSITAFYIGMIGQSGWQTALKDAESEIEKANVIIQGRTAIFITISFSPLTFAHLIKLTNWQIVKQIKVSISKPLVYASFIALAVNIFIIFTPGVNDTIFKLMGYEGDHKWSASTIWVFFASVGLAFVPSLGILIVDGITFYSYHFAPKSWQRNRNIVNKMVEEDKKIEAAKLNKRRKKHK